MRRIHTFGAEGDTIESIESEPKQKTSEGCLTLHAEAQKAETTPGHSDTQTRLYKN